jgi:regulator of sigma E protease
MTSFLFNALSFLVVLTPLVFIHELGHYLIARRNGVKIDIFSIGFGPELFGWNDRSGTRWRVSAIPIGGYVKMFGDADPASMPSDTVLSMTPEERKVSFFHQSLSARAAIIIAGPAANFLFALLVLTIEFATLGEPYTLPQASEVVANSAAAEAGVQPGDTFVSINGNPVHRFEDLQEMVALNTGTPMAIVVRRHDTDVQLQVTPKVTEQTDHFGNQHRLIMLGVKSTQKDFVRHSLPVAGWDAAVAIGHDVADTLQGIGQMITGARSTEGLSGPLGIAKLSGEFAADGVLSLIGLMALISINLGMVNLFPIPVLDGGHLLFYAAEGILGRPLGQRTQEIGFRLGLALVLTLMVFATWNDLVQMHVVAFLRRLVT